MKETSTDDILFGKGAIQPMVVKFTTPIFLK